jgi:hypothetical protein
MSSAVLCYVRGGGGGLCDGLHFICSCSMGRTGPFAGPLAGARAPREQRPPWNQLRPTAPMRILNLPICFARRSTRHSHRQRPVRPAASPSRVASIALACEPSGHTEC